MGEWLFSAMGANDLLFTNNETNTERLWGVPNCTPFVKDGINNNIVMGRKDAVNPDKTGTKAAAHYILDIEGGKSITLNLRLTKTAQANKISAKKGLTRDLEPILKTFLNHALRKQMSSMLRLSLLRWGPMRPMSCARRLQACYGQNSFSTTMSANG